MLRKHFGMESTDTGMLVLDVAPLAPAAALLKSRDVVLSVDGIRVSLVCATDWC